MVPGSKPTEAFQDKFVKAIAINLFRGSSQAAPRRSIHIPSFQREFFPDITESRLKGILCPNKKPLAVPIGGSGERRLNQTFVPNVDSLDREFQSLEITPEQICMYESMVVGLLRLRKNRVTLLTSPDKLGSRATSLKGTVTRRIAALIEDQLVRTPWARTATFRRVIEDRPVEMADTEDGDQVWKAAGKKKAPAQQPARIAHTEADLRKLTLGALRSLLHDEYGVPHPEIERRSRWKLVELVREIASRQQNDTGVARMWARGPRNARQEQVMKYKQKYQQNFEDDLESIAMTMTSAATQDDNDGLLDELGRVMISDMEDSEIELETGEPEAVRPVKPSDDPPALVPFGVATSETRIDWEELGFHNVPTRKVVKIIRMKTDPDFGVSVNVMWKRSPFLIRQLENLPKVTQVSMSLRGDLEDEILRREKDNVTSGLRSEKRLKARGRNEARVEYFSLRPDFMFVQEKVQGHLEIVMKPELIGQLRAAAERFRKFEQQQPFVCKKSTVRRQKDPSLDDIVDARDKRRPKRSHPLKKLNVLLARILTEMIKKLGNAVKPFRKIEGQISLHKIKNKCQEQRYAAYEAMLDDLRAIERNCEEQKRGPKIAKAAREMIEATDEIFRGYSEEYKKVIPK
jgi:transcription initiation factor TFIID subunit 1